MNTPPLLRRHPSLRWLAPSAVVVLAALAAGGVFSARASAEHDELPSMSPAALIAAVRAPSSTGFSGTVVSKVSLGLPDIPQLSGSGASGGSGTGGVTLPSLLSGSQTLQVWVDGPQEQRIALLGPTDETDLFHSGRNLWQWNSAKRTAEHVILPDASADGSGSDSGKTAPAPLSSFTQDPSSAATSSTFTPQAAALAALAALRPTTKVQVESGQQVADRAAYDLVLTPRTSATTIGSVHIAVDGATKMPLGVQVYPRGSDAPSIDVAFTSVHFTTPSPTYFHFSPPSGAKVHTVHVQGSKARQVLDGHQVHVSGSGWASVLEIDTSEASAMPPRYAVPAQGDSGSSSSSSTSTPVSGAQNSLAQQFPEVTGPWGSGRLVKSNLVNALVLDDGRIFAGAVDPAALFAAAGHN